MRFAIRIDARLLRRLAIGSLLLALLATLALPAITRAGVERLPHRFRNGDLADADQVNQNFDHLMEILATTRSKLSKLESDLAKANATIASQEAELDAVNARIEKWQEILQHLSIVRLPDGQGGDVRTIRVSAVNLQLVSGLGATNGNPNRPYSTEPRDARVNGAGNLIIGYNESRNPDTPLDLDESLDSRLGSHNLVVGHKHNYDSYGGTLCGSNHTVSGAFGTAVGGVGNVASGDGSTVAGGGGNVAGGRLSVVGGGLQRRVTGEFDWRAGGLLQEH